MNGAATKRFTSLHTWAGLVCSWALFIAFFAGSFVVFYQDLQSWADPGIRRVAAQPLSDVQQLIERITQEHPQIKHEFYITLPERGNVVAYWRKVVNGVETQEHEEREFAGGHVIEHDPRPGVLPSFIYRIHYSLGLPVTSGMYLLGFVCVIYLLALLSGVVIHAPHLAKDLFALRIGKNLKRFWQDAHNVVGVLSLPFHAIFAYTGAMFCILGLLAVSVNILALRGAATQAIARASQVAPLPQASGVEAAMLSPAQLIAAAARAAPGFTPTFLTYRNYGDRAATIEMYGEAPGDLVESARVVLYAHSGELVGVARPGHAPLGLASMGVMMGLHFGHYGGAIIKSMYFTLGLAGAFLFYSGNLLWIESRRRRRSAEQPYVHKLMAQLTVGICIGCCFGIAALFIANKLPPLPFVPAEHTDKVVYYIVFTSSIAYALLRPPARAAFHLLMAVAVTCAFIPIVNAVVTGDHPLRSARDGLWTVFRVDLAALVMACGFAWIARTTRNRAYSGDLNSVWSLEPVRQADVA